MKKFSSIVCFLGLFVGSLQAQANPCNQGEAWNGIDGIGTSNDQSDAIDQCNDSLDTQAANIQLSLWTNECLTFGGTAYIPQSGPHSCGASNCTEVDGIWTCTGTIGICCDFPF